MNIDTQLPESGVGFVTNNRGASGEFQFGQQSSIDAALAVAAAWNGLHSDRPFSIGQISNKGGGKMPPHQSHKLGVDIVPDRCGKMGRTSRFRSVMRNMIER